MPTAGCSICGVLPGLAPAIVGAWNEILAQMGVARIKSIGDTSSRAMAAYSVSGSWVARCMTLPKKCRAGWRELTRAPKIPGGWTEVARYIRAADPSPPPGDRP